MFAWGDKIMVPSGAHLAPWIVDHELIHLRQQKEYGGVNPWWDEYLASDRFRLNQELEAHVEEYASYCRHNRDRNDQYRYLMIVAGRLAHKMYGGVITRREAFQRIKRGY